MVNWKPPEATPQEATAAPRSASVKVPAELHAYEFLFTEGHITPGFIETMKRDYAKAWKRLCKNSEYIAKFKGADYDRHWILWQVDCCEPCNTYIRLFKVFRDKGLMSFTDNELYTCFGLYEYKPQGATE